MSASQMKPPHVFLRLSPVEPSVVFDTYWRFAAERQEVFFRRIAGEPPPWTTDSVIAEHRFTNAYRASDRVSQYLIQEVINKGPQELAEVFFRIILFKLFNRIETWELLAAKVGQPSYAEFDYRLYDCLLTRALRDGQRIYSAAYIMPSGGKHGHGRKHRDHLQLLEMMMRDEVAERIAGCRTMKAGFELLRSYPMIGDFLGYQFITDLNYSSVGNFSETEFVVPGPGARDGIRKCFTSSGGLNDADLIRLAMDRQDAEFARLDVKFKSLWGRPLQLIDCQNLFCEVGKYARVTHPEVHGVSGRVRIKQKYRLNPTPIRYWYPPKWGLNDLIRAMEV